MALKQLKILGVKVSVTTKPEVLGFVTTSLKKKQKFFISTPNPEMVVEAQKNSLFLEALNSADVALPDGVGILYAAKFLGLGIHERLAGREVFNDLLALANKEKLKIFLLGATDEVNRKTVEKIKKGFPKVSVKGNSGPVFDSKLHYANKSYRKIDNDVLLEINNFKPDILFVAFGAPKQELWVFKNFPKLKAGGVMVVGGAFNYFVGKMAKPPEWVARGGLEWIWRLLLEPTRIFRILNAIVIFPLLVLKSKLTARAD